MDAVRDPVPTHLCRSSKAAILFAGALVLAACSTCKAKPHPRYDHGPNVPGRSITILRASATEIAFEIWVKFIEGQIYHRLPVERLRSRWGQLENRLTAAEADDIILLSRGVSAEVFHG